MGVSRISQISKFSRISRTWSDSPLFSRVWGPSRISKFSEISRKWTFLKDPFAKRPLFWNPQNLKGSMRDIRDVLGVAKRAAFQKGSLADVPPERKPERGYVRRNENRRRGYVRMFPRTKPERGHIHQNRAFKNSPFYLPVNICKILFPEGQRHTN